MTDPSIPTPAQLGLPADAPASQYQAALKAAGFTIDEAPLTGVEAAPEPAPPELIPLPPFSSGGVTAQAPEVVTSFRDPVSGATYTITRS